MKLVASTTLTKQSQEQTASKNEILAEKDEWASARLESRVKTFLFIK